MNKYPFTGIHVVAELYGINPDLLNDTMFLGMALKKGIEESGATLCSMQHKVFEPSGVTVLGLLSESHTSIHTYPEEGALFFDAFTCGTECDPHAILEALIGHLEPTVKEIQTIKRGEKVV